MAVSQRYQPSHPASQTAVYALDCSSILPPGVGILVATLNVFINTTPPLINDDFVQTDRAFQGRRTWVTLAGGQPGTDYQLSWTVTDSQASTWIVTATLLCAATS